MKKVFIIFIICIFSILIFANISLEEVLSTYKSKSISYQKESVVYSINSKAILKALSPLLPQISYYISMDTSSLATSYTYSQGIRASQTIFNIPMALNLASSKRESDIALMNFKVNKFNLIMNVIDKYFTVLSFQERLHIDSIITSREEENIKKSKIMFKNGIISRTDLLNIQSNFYTIQAAYHSDKKEYIKAKSDFSVLTGIISEEHFEDIDSIPLIDMNNWDIENILADLPEYKIFKYYYSIKSINVASASSSFLPTASLSIGAGLSDSVLDFDYNNFMDNYSLNAGLSIDFPVFTGFSRTIGVINSSLEKKGAYLDMINQENILRTEIENFPLTVEQILALFKSNINIMMAQYDIFEKSVKMYEKGEISSLDYISYQKNYYDAVINLLEAKKQLYLTYYRYLYYLRRIQ